MRSFFLAGIVLGPMFYTLVLVQMATRAGFDITRQPLSLLALGDAGWIQTANFIVTGLLGFALALALFALNRGAPGVAAACLIALFGVGIIIAGLFPADPSMGFPPGAPEGVPAEMSQSARMHGLGFMVSFTALMLAIVALGVMFWGANTGLAVASFIVALLIPVLVGAGMARMEWASLAFFFVGVLAFGWLTVISYLLWHTN